MRPAAMAAFAAALLATGLAGPLPLHAASFDCAKASTPDERAVCADPALSALDSEMGALWYSYSRVQLMMGASGARRDDARAFLAARSKCGADVSCLGTLYRQRNATLKQQIAAALDNLARQANADPAPTAAPPAPQPVMDEVSAMFGRCAAAGGELKGNAWPDMMTADLDHDGQPDYVLNAQNLRCDGAATAYCANDGCDVSASLSRANYSPMRLRGSRPTLVQGTDFTVLDLWVDRLQCNAAPGAACWGTWRWNGSALAPSYAVRATPP